MPFRYRLQKVLEVRGRVEDGRRKELRSAQEAYRGQLDRLHGLRMRHMNVQHEWSARLEKGITPYEAMLYQSFFQHSRRDVETQSERAGHAKLVVDERRRAFVEARQQREVIEKFKERKYHEYVREEERRLNNLLNELGVIAYNKAEETPG